MSRRFPLNIAETLDSSPLRDHAALNILWATLNTDAGVPETLLVGGCVRNIILNRPVTDIDLATTLTPEQVMARAAAAGLRAIPTGIDHGTVTVVVNGTGFEVTTLRTDQTTDGRHAVVQFGTDWMVDAARRDFTMNALYADLDGHIYDPLGHGLRDARAGAVKFVGNAADRVAEDYLRILRFFRFHAHYGVGAIDRDGVAVCSAAAPKLTTLSRERITDELLKWLSATDPVPSLRTAYVRGIMRYLIPAACDLDVLERVVQMQGQSSVDPAHAGAPLVKDPGLRRDDTMTLLRLLVLLNGADPQPILRLSAKAARFIQTVETVVLEPVHDVLAAKRDIYRHGAPVFWARLMLDVAEVGGSLIPPDLLALRDWTPPKFPVTAADLMAREGLKPGPKLGQRLKELEMEWVAKGFLGG